MSGSLDLAIVALRVGGRWFGASVGDVREVVARHELTRLPSLPPHIAGLATVRGNTVPVVELSALVPDIPEGPAARTTPRWVVVQSGDRDVALAADETRGVLRVSAYAGELERGDDSDILGRAVLWEDRCLRLLDVDRIVAVVEGTQAP